MKNRFNPFRSVIKAYSCSSSLHVVFVGSIAALLASQTVQAAKYYWDVNGSGTSGFSTVVGAWNDTNVFWNTSSTGTTGGTTTAVTDSTMDLVIQPATTNTGSITISGATKNASSITFAANVGPTTTITGGTINIGGTGTSSGIFQQSSGANTISSALQLNSGNTAFSFSNSSTGLLTIGAVTGTATSGNVTQVITAGSSSSGGITLNGAIADVSGSATKVALTVSSSGSGVTTLSATNTYTGATTLNAGTLQLSGTAGKITGTSGLTVNSGSTFIDGDTTTAANNNGIANRINSGTTLTLNAGTFQLAASATTHTQSFNTLSFGAGSSTINTNAATGTNTLTFGAASGSNYTRAVGGLVNINTQTGFNVAFTNAVTGAANVTGSGADAILFGATLNNTDFIKAAAGNVSAAAYTTTGTTTWTAAKNMDVTGTNGSAYTAVNVNSVRFNTAGANTVTLAAGTNAIAGGILVTNNVGSGSSLITGGTITGGTSSELLVIQNNTAAGLQIASTIADNASTALTKGGAGTLILSGPNSYTGGTNVNAGVLTFLNTGAKSSTGTTTVATGATLGLGVATSGSFFTSANVDSLFAGTLSGVTNGAGSNVGIDTTQGDFTYSTSVAGSPARGLVKLGNNTLTLSGASTYTGATAVNAGTLKLANATAINTTSGLTVATGATFDINGNNSTIGLLSGSGTVTNNAASGTTTVAATGGTWTGSITDGATAKVALKLNSAVAMTLGGTNTFTGGLIIGDVSNTPLTVSSGAALGNGLVTVSNNSSLRLTNGQTITGKTVSIQGTGGGPSGGNGNGALNLISGTGTWAGDVQSGVGTNGGRIGVTGAGTLTISGNISNNTGTSGTGLDVTFNADTTLGSGIVILSGTSNTYTGSTIVGRGVLKISDSNILPSTSILQVGTASNVGGRFDLNGYNQTVGGLQRTQAAAVEGTILNNGAADSTLSISTASGTAFSHNGVIKDGTTNKVSIIKSGAGSQTFAAANTYTGGTTINGGTLLLSGAFNMPATGTLQVNSGGTFSLADATARTTSTAQLGLASGSSLAFDWNAGAVDTLTSTAAATTTGNVGIIINNTSPTGSGGTLISSPSGGLTTANSTQYFLANNSNFTAGLTVTDTAVSIGAQTAVTANLLFWQGNKVLGTSTAGVDNALALSTGAVSNWSTAVGTYTATGVVPGSTADAIFSSTTTPVQQSTVLGADMTLKSVTFNDGTATTLGGGNILTLLSTVGTAGTGTAGGGSAITVTSAAANPTISANVALGASQTWNVANGKTLLVSGAISGVSNLTKADTGTLTLSGANSFTGSTTISAGTLNLLNQNAVQNSTLTMGGGTLVFDQTVSGNAFTFGGLAAASAGAGYDITLLNNAGTPAAIALTVGGNNAASTYAGVLSGAGGSLIKTGTGTLTLSGANSISGGLTVTVGKILTENNMTFGDVNLNGGTLSLGGAAASYTTNINGLTGNGTLMTGDSGGFARTLYVGNGDATSDFSGVINKGGNRGLALNKVGSGTLTLSGSSANVDGGGTGSFTTTVQAGILILNKSGVVALPGANVGVSGGTLKLAGTGGNQIADTASVTLSGGSFDLNNLSETVGAVSITAPAASGDTITVGNLTGTSYAASNTTGNAIIAANLLVNSTAGFTKSGAGSAMLSGTNTYTGATTLTDGTLSVGATANLGAAASNLVFNGGTLQITGTTLTSFAGIGHTVSFTAAKAVGLDINNAANTFTVGQALNQTTGSFTKLGAGTVILNQTNTFTGGMIISEGTLSFSADTNLGGTTGTPTITLNGGTLKDTNSSAVVLNAAHALIIGASGGTITSTSTSSTLTLSPISGAGNALTINSGNNSSGFVVFSQSSTNTLGSLTLGSSTTGVDFGTNTTITNAVSIGTGQIVHLDTGGADANVGSYSNVSFALNGGMLRNRFGQNTLTTPITLAASSSIGNRNTTGFFKFSGNVSSSASSGTQTLTFGDGTAGSGIGSITQDAASVIGNGGTGGTLALTVNMGGTNGMVTLNGANGYTGATTLTGGTLSVGATANLGAAASNLVFDGGTLQITGTALTSFSGIGHTVSFTAGKAVGLDINNAANSFTVDQVLNQTTGGFTKLGAGTAILDQANTYSGATTVSAGTLTLSGARTGSSGAITVADTAATNATLNIQNGTIALGANSFTVGNAPSTAATATATQSGGAVSFTSGNGLLLANAGVAGSSSIYNLSGGSITTFASTTRGIILGTNSDKGSSTFNLSDTGVLNMTAASGGGGDAILEIGRSDATASNTTNLFAQTGGTANVGILAMGGKVTTGTGSSSGVSSTLTLTGGTFAANQFTVMGAGNTNTIAINIGGTADVTLPAFPTTALGASSTATISFDGGTLRPGATSTNYMGSISSAYIEDGGAKFNVASTKDITITQNLLTHVTSTGGGLTKSGAGQLTLSGTNTYTGATTITEGSLAIGSGGSIASSAQIIAGANTTLDVSAVSFTLGASNAQTLSGTGAISGNMTVGANGTLAIGNSPGTMTFNDNLGLNADSVSNFEINGFTSGSYDLALAAVSGSQTVSFNGGTLNLLFLSGFNTTGAVKIFDFDAYAGSGFTSVVSTGLASGFTASFDQASGFVTVVPEPRAALLGGLGIFALFRRRRA